MQLNQCQSTHNQLSLFVEHLTNLDFSYIDPIVGLSGQSWSVDMLISGALNHAGMLIDFGEIKKSIKADIESFWDHKLLLPTQLTHQLMPAAHTQHQPAPAHPHLKLSWADPQGHYLTHTGPDFAVYQVPCAGLDQAFLEQHLQQLLLKKWRCPQIQSIKITFHEETLHPGQQAAFFQYSHGLKLHLGACQRIAHGHRSKLRVFTAQGFNPSLSQQLAGQLNHGYFLDATTIEHETTTTITLSYQAPEGFYQLCLPRDKCIIMQTETTIENIALYLLNSARQTISQEICSVQVYEGWHKGALATYQA